MASFSSVSAAVSRAFILGAGLGTRLRPLTDETPKPLLPIQGEPMVAHALRHLQGAGVRNAIINTHHAAGKWLKAFPTKRYGLIELEFRHEPILLDTGGGLKNVEDFLLKAEQPFIIYNGDIVTDLPLERAIQHHLAEQNLVTLVLRSRELPRHVTLGKDGLIRDIRGMLGSGSSGEYLFTGIHIANPAVFQFIPDARPCSIIPLYLEMIRTKQRIGGLVIDEGTWSDVGTLPEYQRLNS